MDAVHRGPGVGPSGGVRWTRCRKEGGASASSVGGYLLLASFALICFTSCLLRLVIEGDPTVENLVEYSTILISTVFFFSFQITIFFVVLLVGLISHDQNLKLFQT